MNERKPTNKWKSNSGEKERGKQQQKKRQAKV